MELEDKLKKIIREEIAKEIIKEEERDSLLLVDRIANDIVSKVMKRIFVLKDKGHDTNNIIRRVIIKLKEKLR